MELLTGRWMTFLFALRSASAKFALESGGALTKAWRTGLFRLIEWLTRSRGRFEIVADRRSRGSGILAGGRFN